MNDIHCQTVFRIKWAVSCGGFSECHEKLFMTLEGAKNFSDQLSNSADLIRAPRILHVEKLEEVKVFA